MEEYLQATKAALESGVPGKVHAVLGNEACDLDSAVSALAYAYYLHKALPSADTLPVPVLNIPRADYPLRTEVIHHLDKLKVNRLHLTFRDDIDLAALHKDSKLTLTLVDHNVLSSADCSLDGAVVEVIDHHKWERPASEKESVTVELVGSCCTLVAEKLINDDSFHIDHQMAELLYGPTVLDTINLSEDAGIKTPKDVTVIERLQTLRAEGAPERHDVYSSLQTARADVSALVTLDVLRKDMKMVSSPLVKVAFSSVPIQLQTFLLRDDIVPSLSSFATHQGAAVVILMSLSVSASGEPQRQLAVFSEDAALRQQVEDLLNTSTEPALKLSPLTSESDHIIVFAQGNAKASRKKILPHVEAHINDISLNKAESDLRSSLSGDSGIVDLSPEAPAAVPVPHLPDSVSVSGVTLEESTPDTADLITPASADTGDLLGHGSAKTNELVLLHERKEGAISLLTPTIPATDVALADSAGVEVDDLLGLNFNQVSIDSSEKVDKAAESLFTLAGVITDSTETDTVSAESDQVTLSPNILPDINNLAGNKEESSEVLIPQAEVKTDDTNDAELVKDNRATPSPDVIPTIADLAGNKEDANATTNPLLTLTGVTTDDTTTDAVLVDVDWQTPSPDSIPDSVKPGGLLDLDFFAPKDEVNSDTASDGSLDNYEKDTEPKDVPARSEQEVLDLISDALREELKAKTPSPLHSPSTDVSEEKAKETSSSANIANSEVPSVGQAQKYTEDLFEHHEGVLIEASPLHGMTPDPSATPDNMSQPISPQSQSYPGTPPNSYIDLTIMDTQQGQRELPSFMNADMVRRIHEKKAALSVIDEQQVAGISGNEDEHFPFTPQNSVSDKAHDHLTRQQALPSFDNAEMVEAVHSKRSDISSDKVEPITSEAMKFPYTPPNSFVDSSFAAMRKRGGPLHLVEEDFADRMNKKKHKFEEEEDSKASLDEVAGVELQKEAIRNMTKDIQDEVNDHSAKVAFCDDAQAQAEIKEEHDQSENVVANTIAQDKKEMESKKDAAPPQPSIWDEKTVRYMGEDELDVANQLTQEVIQKALEDIEASGESLQAELAQAEHYYDSDEAEEIQLVAASALDTMTEIESQHIDQVLNAPHQQPEETGSLAMLAQGHPLKEQDQYESLSELLPSGRKADGSGDAVGKTVDVTESDESARRLAAGGNMVKFSGVTPAPVVDPLRTPVTADFDSRAHSDSMLSETSMGGESDLSQNTTQFLARLHSDTGASILSVSGNSEDLMIAAQELDVAQVIVDDAMSAAIDIVAKSEIPKETLTRQGDWDEETLKTRMDQLPEQVATDTPVSASRAAPRGGRQSPEIPPALHSAHKKRIVPNLSLLRDQELREPGESPEETPGRGPGHAHTASASSSDGEPLGSLTDLHTPDDLTTPEALADSIFDGELDWEDKRKILHGGDASEDVPVEPIPEYTAKEEFEDEKNWRSVTVGDRTFRIDMKVIEPYKRVLSHGGYYGDGFNAIIVFTGYYLPDKRRRDYHYVMDNLFLYVLSTLELLVVEDYMVIYFHGATPKQRMPSLRWLKRCYEMIDRRLRKNLKSLLIVHPTLWIKTIMTLTKPFISSKFSSKLKYVRGLKELADAVPMEYIFVPDEIKLFDEAKFRQSAPAAT